MSYHEGRRKGIMTDGTTQRKRRIPREIRDIPFSSNAMRFSGWQWLIVLIVVVLCMSLIPVVWERAEKFEPGPDYRVPFELGYDYWMYDRLCRSYKDKNVIPLIGDSVIWGHYVASEQTLSQYLNRLSDDSNTYVNAAIDGSHQVALAGLIKYYGKNLTGKKVILHCNPLWLTNKKRDMRSKKEQQFNHPDLVPQFLPRISCYRKDDTDRLGIVIKRVMPFAAWVNHLRIAYFDSLDIYTWSQEHPDRPLWSAVTFTLPSHSNIPPETDPIPWTQTDKYGMQGPPWVEIDESLQWSFFEQAIETLESRGNKVFVLVGPYNRHMLKETSATVYDQLMLDIGARLKEKNIPYFLPSPLPSEKYADSSHPLSEGYEMLAGEILKNDAFLDFVGESKEILP
ncbi:MAG: hypothetical protein KAH23_05825 [Kiritimatiellae bacterium]|nr:hypothetical protein [Kiritimatiellia bacterium]